jgi:hypothetical protein
MNIHKARCLRAIEGQVQLLALPSKQLHHTAFTVCMVTTVALSLVAACRFHFTGQRLVIARGQLRLMIGCLKCLAQAWPQAEKNLIDLQAIAREILGATKGQQGELAREDMSQFSAGLELNQPPENDLSVYCNNLVIPSTDITGLDDMWCFDNMLPMYWNS